jgi:hypothetical protein
VPVRFTAAGVAALAMVSAASAAGGRPKGAPATCGHQSLARFQPSARDLVVGPLTLVGAREYSPPAAIATFGGQKYPALVRAGHRAVVEVVRSESRTTSLLYADHRGTQGGRKVTDGDRVVDFRSCSRAKAGSSYGGRAATFWSGFVLASRPRCVHLRIWVDRERTPRRVGIPAGARCG